MGVVPACPILEVDVARDPLRGARAGDLALEVVWLPLGPATRALDDVVVAAGAPLSGVRAKTR